jgi:MoaA/NifB/PqqE/SkfB family radical SAM enzyme
MNPVRLASFGIKHLLGYKVQGIGLILTRRCNLTCSYCKIIEYQKEELSTNDWKKIIRKFQDNNHRHFIFTGGEPLLYPGVFDLITFASRRSLTSLITNGTLLTPERFKRMKNLDFLTFSYDSDSDTHQKNTTTKLSLITRMCKRYSITPSAIITITKRNVQEIPTIIKRLNRYKIPALLSLIHSDVGPYDFRGHAPDLEFQTPEDLKRLNRLQKTLLKMKRNGYRISEKDAFIKNLSTYAKKEYQIKCPATEPFFTIDTDGAIKACHDMPASSINALTFRNYNKMKKEVKKTVFKDCTCYYDCYFNSQYSLLEWPHLKRVTRCFSNIMR